MLYLHDKPTYELYLVSFFPPSQVGLLDYGQVKDLPENLRLGYANLVLAIADNDPIRASESYRY
jgi:predicted unusual protein kinase regulating ubiquinone biosynthesis (AarF/ABC1/UbiB family)